MQLLRWLLVTLVIAVCGCGGAGSRNGLSTLASVTEKVGPNGSVIDLGLPSHEVVTFAPGALTSSISVTVSVTSATLLNSSRTYTPSSHSISLQFDHAALATGAEVTIGALYTGELEVNDPTTYLFVDVSGEQVVGSATNLDSAPQIDIYSGASSFVAHIGSSLRTLGKRTRGLSTDTWQLIRHEANQEETNPQIRPYEFQTASATRDDAYAADRADDLAVISSACWKPVDAQPLSDGAQHRVAILVHGIENRINNMSALAFYLANLRDQSGQPFYDHVWGIDHDWEGSIAPRGDQLAQFINNKLGPSATKADIFAHSQGTLVTRYALEVSGGSAAAHVSRVFLFAPMNKGIPLQLTSIPRLLPSFDAMGYTGVKEMLRAPSELIKIYWYILDKLVDSSSEGQVAYYTFTGGDSHDYFPTPLGFSLGDLVSAIYQSSDNDGIVPWDSSKYQPANHTNGWTELPASPYGVHFNLDHSDVVGRFYGDSASLNLDQPEYNAASQPNILRSLVLGLTTGSSGGLQSAAAWPKDRGDSFNSGRGLGQSAQGILRWSLPTEVPTLDQVSPIIAADGTIFVGIGHAIVAINGQSGIQRWAFTTGDGIAGAGALAANGTLYVGSLDGSLYALDSSRGSKLWSFTTSGSIYGSPAIGSDGTVYVGSDDHNIYAINGSSGIQKWVLTTGAAIDTTPAIAADGTVIVLSEDGTLYALDASTGSKKWEFQTRGTHVSSPAISANDTVFFTSGGSVYAVNGMSGALEWQSSLGSTTHSSPALGMNGLIYVGGGGPLWALDANTGSLIWTFNTESVIESSPSVATDGTVFIGSDDRNLYAIDGSSGSLRWSYATGQQVESSPGIGVDGTIYIGGANYVFAIK